MIRVYYIDMADKSSREDFYNTIEKELPLPDYFGSNLDALSDVFSEYGDGWDIIFYNMRKFMESEPDYFKKLTKMCRMAEKEYGNICIRFYP